MITKHRKLATALRISVCCCASLAFPAAHAQDAPCGISSIHESTQLAYPPIAKAAHVEGVVIYLARFSPIGDVESLRILSGPVMLQYAATEFLKGWKVNPYSGPRECPIVIRFVHGSESEHPKTLVTRIDFQHVLITSESYPPTTTYSVAAQ